MSYHLREFSGTSTTVRWLKAPVHADGGLRNLFLKVPQHERVGPLGRITTLERDIDKPDLYGRSVAHHAYASSNTIRFIELAWRATSLRISPHAPVLGIFTPSLLTRCQRGIGPGNIVASAWLRNQADVAPKHRVARAPLNCLNIDSVRERPRSVLVIVCKVPGQSRAVRIKLELEPALAFSLYPLPVLLNV